MTALAKHLLVLLLGLVVLAFVLHSWIQDPGGSPFSEESTFTAWLLVTCMVSIVCLGLGVRLFAELRRVRRRPILEERPQTTTEKPSTAALEAPSAPGPWQPGEVLDGRYRVRQARGGGMGVVYLCHDFEGGPVAVKTLATDTRWSEAAVQRFKREALLWIQLGKHPHIVQARHVRQIGDDLAIFMEMVPADEHGRVSLTDWIRSGGLSLTDTLKLAVHVCRGMSYAHNEVGLVHRDLKPSNVLVAPGMVAKVTDFGLAKALADADVAYQPSPTRQVEGASLPTLTMTGGAFGTPPYMAPEQWQDAKQVDTRADIYAFGCMLYEMLTRRHVNGLPVGQDTFTMDDWLRFHQRGEMPDLSTYSPKVSADLRTVVMRCTAKVPTQRHPSFEKLGIELHEVYKVLTREAVRILPVSQERTSDLVSRASSLEQLGLCEQAAACCQQVLEQNPDDALASYIRGVALTRMQRPREALRCFERFVGLRPRSASGWTSKGSILRQLGGDEEAKACYVKADDLLRVEREMGERRPHSVPERLRIRSELERWPPGEGVEDPSLRERVILVSDDDRRHLDIIRGYLEPLGPTLKTCLDPYETIEAVRKYRPDLLITDVTKPNLDGFSLISILRRDFPDLPVLIFTVRDELEDIERGVEVGADDYLIKFSSAEELRYRVRMLLALHRLAESRLSGADLLPLPCPPVPAFYVQTMVVAAGKSGLQLDRSMAQELHEWPRWCRALGVPLARVKLCAPAEVPLDDVARASSSLVCVDMREHSDAETVNKLRGLGREIKIIVAGPQQEAETSLSARADAYIVKPVTREKFVDTVLGLFPPTVYPTGSEQG